MKNLVKALPEDVRTAAIEAVRDVVDEAVEKQLLPPPGCPGPWPVTTIESVAAEAECLRRREAGQGRRSERLGADVGQIEGHVEYPSTLVVGSIW